MLTTTRDPMTGQDVADPASAPFVIEGTGESALRIYFESEQTRQAYLAVGFEAPSETLLRAHNGTLHVAQEM
jgi:hypothetical protein